jgi:hypothetical protein
LQQLDNTRLFIANASGICNPSVVSAGLDQMQGSNGAAESKSLMIWAKHSVAVDLGVLIDSSVLLASETFVTIGTPPYTRTKIIIL